MFGIVVAGCAIYGAVVGYLVADCIETDVAIGQLDEEIQKTLEETDKMIQEHLRIQAELGEQLEGLVESTEDFMKMHNISIELAEEAGVEEEYMLRTLEDGEKFFNE